MELKKEDIYGELKWVSDGYGHFELLVDTEFMSINNPLIRLQIEKRYPDCHDKLAQVNYEMMYYDDEDGGKAAMAQCTDDLWADFLDQMMFELYDTSEYDEVEPVSIEYANKCIKEWESL